MCIIEAFDYEGKHIEIMPDNDPIDPRKYKNLGTILYWKGARTHIGDNGVEVEELRRMADERKVIYLPVYAYSHGGLTIRSYPFSCRWDSGQSGIIYVERERVRQEFGVKRISPKLRKRVINILNGELETYASYLEGTICGYVTTDVSDTDTVIDSCWGFYDMSECIDAAKLSIDRKEEQVCVR